MEHSGTVLIREASEDPGIAGKVKSGGPKLSGELPVTKG